MPRELYYKEALKLGQKEYRSAVAENINPYLPVLDEIVPPEKALTGIRVGVVQIPMWFVVGTKTGGRVSAFSKSFLPLLDEGTEFADKWEALYRSHLSEGIRDPIKAYEYLNRYGVVDIEYAPALPLPSRRYADFFRSSIISGAGNPFLTPFYTQSGEVIGARQHELSLEQILRMDFLVDNVIGDIPGYEDLTVIGQKTVDMVGIGQAKKKSRIVE